MFFLVNITCNIIQKMNILNCVILFIIIWNHMTAGVEQRSSKLNDLSRNTTFEVKSNSVSMGQKRDLHKDLRDADKLDCNSTVINRENFTKQPEGGYRRSSEPEQRELNKSNEDYYRGTHQQLIRIFSIDYKTPALNSDSEIYAVMIVVLYSAVVAIGITICIVVHRKYGFDKTEHRCTINTNRLTQKHLINNTALETGRLKATINKKCLLGDRPPSYGACVV